MVNATHENQTHISDEMVAQGLEYLGKSRIRTIPTVATYPDFVEELLRCAAGKQANENRIEITEEMVNRGLEFFERSVINTIPTIATYPDFVRDLLEFALLDRNGVEIPAAE